MKVSHLEISNFRGIRSAELHFDGHALLVGTNNVGKSTICEALDLVLGPDRLSRFPPVEEFDFHNARYLSTPQTEEESATPIPIRVEVILTDLDSEVENRCGANIEFWHVSERRLLTEGEAGFANPPDVITCLRLETLARYNPDEDEFEAQTYFSHSPHAEEGQLTVVRKDIKRLFGFLYLRALRTGSRALSLERGSLLDLLLRLKKVRTGLWEKSIAKLRALDIEQDADELTDVLVSIEKRLAQYIPSAADGRVTKLHVSQLTREHLRKTMSFFMAMSKDQDHVPFSLTGTGTLNTLVLALLSFIGDLKPATVIFAMEEPEIALPPHTQRRIADYLLRQTTQAFVTSHSPFVVERFDPANTLLLSRDEHGRVGAQCVSEASGLKENDYRRYSRQGLTECMLGKGSIVVEGITEFHALPVVARRMEEMNPALQPLDVAGVAFFNADSEGAMPKFGSFFKTLGLDTFAFYDYLPRKPEEKKKFSDVFDIDFEHAHTGFENLVVSEMSGDSLWTFLSAIRDSGEGSKFPIPAERPDDATIKKMVASALGKNKGAGWAARLFEECPFEELPVSITQFLTQIYERFPWPAVIATEDESAHAVADTAAAG